MKLTVSDLVDQLELIREDVQFVLDNEVMGMKGECLGRLDRVMNELGALQMLLESPENNEDNVAHISK